VRVGFLKLMFLQRIVSYFPPECPLREKSALISLIVHAVVRFPSWVACDSPAGTPSIDLP